MNLLVFLDENTDVEVLDGQATVIHSASSRMHIIRTSSATRAQLAVLPGVVCITDTELPPEYAQRLNSQESIFAEAFAVRETSKERLGDGLPWDSPGFEPPDPPSKISNEPEHHESNCSDPIKQKGRNHHDQ
jgi:hypothetical protein